MDQQQLEQFFLKISSINQKAANLANLLRWGFLAPIKIELKEPLKRRQVIDYINNTSDEITINNSHLTYDGTDYHPWQSAIDSVEIINDKSDPETMKGQDERWTAFKNDKIISWFNLTNDSHHLYRIYVDNRAASLGILVTFAEIIDDSYNPGTKCNCDTTKYESDFDSDFDSLFNDSELEVSSVSSGEKDTQ